MEAGPVAFSSQMFRIEPCDAASAMQAAIPDIHGTVGQGKYCLGPCQ